MESSQVYSSEKIKNADNIIINPAIEEKQDVQILNQNNFIDLTNALVELVNKLTFLTAVRGISGDIRVTPLSTPNMSTLSVLGNMQLIGGYSANNQIPGQMNNLAIQSNINNITIS